LYDAIVIGAGMAGLAATKRLADAGRSVICLEARERVGGRAQSLTLPNGARIDRGCHWLHGADTNPLVDVAEKLGFYVLRQNTDWALQFNRKALGEERFADWQVYADAIEERLEALDPGGPDCSMGDLAPAESPWNPLRSAFYTFIWGATPDKISALDHARGQDGDQNWRMPLGYGSLVARFAEGLPVALSTPVSAIRWNGGTVMVETPRGTLEAARVVLAIPSSLIRDEAIRFDPGLPETKLQAAENLPLGSDNKVHLAIEGTPFGPHEDFQGLVRHDRVDCAHFHFHPWGAPIVEGYYGGEHSRQLAGAGTQAIAADAIDQLAGYFGESVRKQLTPLHSTAWDLETWTRGAYSYARPGHAFAREALAEPIEGRLFFCGEATNAQHPATCHGAYLSGLRAAGEVMEQNAA